MSYLTAEQIGFIGEVEVHRRCIVAQLHTTKPEPDRTGKDLVVEWPFPHPEDGQSYDTRPAPLACIVQVKSLLPGSKSVNLTLTVAERLIRDPRPAFIVISRLSEDSENAIVVSTHVIHLRGIPLAKILRRLRQESRKPKNAKLNEKDITFKVADAVPIHMTPSALREHLESMIGSDMGSYAVAKEHEVKTVGFGDHPVGVKITFAPDTVENLARRSLDRAADRCEQCQVRS